MTDKDDDPIKAKDYLAILWIFLVIIGVCVAAAIGNGLYHKIIAWFGVH